jgi:DNA-binding HxlR family transcriptional regulator
MLTAENHPIDVLNPFCPSRRTLALLADKWVMLVIVSLHKRGAQRNGELKRTLGDVSQKMLTQTLRQLEHCGLVKRTSYHEVPPRVVYELTELGESLTEPIKAMRDWAERYYADVENAQKNGFVEDDDEGVE